MTFLSNQSPALPLINRSQTWKALCAIDPIQLKKSLFIGTTSAALICLALKIQNLEPLASLIPPISILGALTSDNIESFQIAAGINSASLTLRTLVDKKDYPNVGGKEVAIALYVGILSSTILGTVADCYRRTKKPENFSQARIREIS